MFSMSTVPACVLSAANITDENIRAELFTKTHFVMVMSVFPPVFPTINVASVQFLLFVQEEPLIAKFPLKTRKWNTLHVLRLLPLIAEQLLT